ncbi:MAG: winged helix-turn-helix domain-containing protein, partial [Naasia sp.]
MALPFGSHRLAVLLGDWRRGDGAGYRRLSDALRLLIIDGRVPVGSRLPSERELAAALDASRTTITAALDDLRAQGYLETRRGSGSIAVVPGSRGELLGPPGLALEFATASSPAAPGMQAA